MFEIQIESLGAVYDDKPRNEVAALLREVASRLEAGDVKGEIVGDGEVVGKFGFKDVQCCTCEQVFDQLLLTEKRQCPYCKSGNWVYGLIDEV